MRERPPEIQNMIFRASSERNRRRKTPEGKDKALSDAGRKGAVISNQNQEVKNARKDEDEAALAESNKVDAFKQELIHEHGEEEAEKILRDLE